MSRRLTQQAVEVAIPELRAEAKLRDMEARLTALEKPRGSVGFYMRLEADVTNAFTNNTAVKVPMDTAVYDPFSMVDLSNDWVTLPYDGWWLFEGGALQTATFVATGAITYQTTLGGSTATGFSSPVFYTYFPTAAARKSVKGFVLARCNKGDQVFLQYFQNSGATLTADGLAGDFNFLRGVWLPS